MVMMTMMRMSNDHWPSCTTMHWGHDERMMGSNNCCKRWGLSSNLRLLKRTILRGLGRDGSHWWIGNANGWTTYLIMGRWDVSFRYGRICHLLPGAGFTTCPLRGELYRIWGPPHHGCWICCKRIPCSGDSHSLTWRMSIPCHGSGLRKQPCTS